MGFEPTGTPVIFELDQNLEEGIAPTDTFKIEYSEDGGSIYDIAGKSATEADYQNVTVNYSTYGLAFKVQRTCYVTPSTNRLKITMTSGECSGKATERVVTF